MRILLVRTMLWIIFVIIIIIIIIIISRTIILCHSLAYEFLADLC
jgi:hypothetical protein